MLLSIVSGIFHGLDVQRKLLTHHLPFMKNKQAVRHREFETDVNEQSKPCTPYKRLLTYEDGREEERWDCLLDRADGTRFVAVPRGLNTSGFISGETTLVCSRNRRHQRPGSDRKNHRRSFLESPDTVVVISNHKELCK